LYPFAHGVRNNGNFALREDVPTVATVLQHAGYRTAAFVSAFVLDRRAGLARGFDVYDDRLELERRGADTVAAAARRVPATPAPPSCGCLSTTRTTRTIRRRPTARRSPIASTTVKSPTTTTRSARCCRGSGHPPAIGGPRSPSPAITVRASASTAKRRTDCSST